MSDALSSFGTLLKIGDGGSPTETFTTIAEVKDIEAPGVEAAMEDVTSHDSPGGWRERIPTLLDAGEVTFDVNFIPTEATHDPSTGLIADAVARTLRNFQLVWPDAGETTWTFSAYVSSFKPSAPVEGVLTASVTLSISGSLGFS